MNLNEFEFIDMASAFQHVLTN